MDLLRLMSESRGFFLRREALELGVDDRTLHGQRARGVLVRIRQGAYCHADVWAGMSPVDQHLARCHASQDLAVKRTVLSHVSALAHLGCPLWNAPLDLVHLTRYVDQASRRAARIAHHRGQLRDVDVIEHEGRLVTNPCRSFLDAATLLSVESGMVSGDWLLRAGLTTQEELWAGKELTNHWPGTLRQEVTLRLLDAGSQSVGESRSRYLFWTMGLPRPVLQCPIYDERGDVIALTDFGWPQRRVYGEFDGRVKYGRLLKPGQEPGDVVFLEKRREDQIRAATDGTMVRFTWTDLHPSSDPAVRLRSLLRSAA